MNQANEEKLLGHLLVLRRNVAQALGREQYVYQLLDSAIESHYRPALERALAEFDRQPAEIKQRVGCP